MIGRIRGILVEKQPPQILIEAAGVGYEIQLPMTSFYQLPDAGEEVTVYTHFVVREDAQLLFGFANQSERALFRELIKANGVGPKMALTILSGMSAAQFVNCVQQQDVNALVKLPGVGKKTAERLLVELKDRLSSLIGDSADNQLAAQANPVENTFVVADDPKEEAISALVALGYKPAQISKTVNNLHRQGMTSEDLIREVLRSML
ncbi:Holliday junction branch migration protein RuvA [Lacimicrobium alkaliphilum]|uniref:Holliday junction branch migration complex subunit RuvA n=1 Tax=Lacimicrobium alkaliphilum TaxID=1526571 RepID=A0ABQ1REQ8_9ALTE|nr:Holliday junction branch migration protein RuvA [Lacimicrobium alkaliphilum]GGD68066.1 Holliday junction ATP-dependent DNA helicase RuvA [Lacimicrobium alkaliphilum]